MDRLWVDKHRPRELKELDYHCDLNEMLLKLSTSEDFPHLLVYGPNGAGKKTRVMCFLASVFQTQQILKVKSELREFKCKTSTQTAECRVISSNYHIEVTPAECDHGDRLVI